MGHVDTHKDYPGYGIVVEGFACRKHNRNAPGRAPTNGKRCDLHVHPGTVLQDRRESPVGATYAVTSFFRTLYSSCWYVNLRTDAAHH